MEIRKFEFAVLEVPDKKLLQAMEADPSVVDEAVEFPEIVVQEPSIPPPQGAMEEAPPPPPPTHTLAEEELARIRTETFNAGYQKAQEEQQAQREAEVQALQQTVETLNNHLIQLNETKQQAHLGQAKDLAELAMVIARKVTGLPLEEIAIREIEAIVEKCLQFLFDQPKINIYVHETMVEPLQSRLANLTFRNSFRGEVTVKAGAALVPGDCTMEWQDGVLQRNQQETVRLIEQTLAAMVAPAE